MTGLEFEGKTVKDAIENACSQLNINAREIKYDVISNGSTGIFGFVGVKKAKIRVLNAIKTEPASPSGQHPEDTSLNSSGPAPREIISLVDEAFQNTRDDVSSKKEPHSDKRPKSYGKKRSQNASGFHRKSVAPAAPHGDPADSQPKSKDIDTILPDVPSKDSSDDSNTGISAIAAPEITIQPDSAPSSEPSLPEAAQVGIVALQKILDYLTDGVSIHREDHPDKLFFRLEGGNSSVLIGKRGQNMEAIQYIIDKIVNKSTTKHIRVQIDIAGYTEKRKENLIKMAERMAQKTIRTGKPSTVGPMNAQDRRIIHITLKNVRGVRTQSIGEGYYRKLMIFPKQSPIRKHEAASDHEEAGNEGA